MLFQEDLQNKTQATISEKSFYSYFKNTPKKLPRVDVLNILSQYCDYENWNDFKVTYTKPDSTKNTTQKLKWIALAVIGIGLLFSLYQFIPSYRTYHFCFIDNDRRQPITQIPIDIIVLNDTQSPFYTKSDSIGCFKWKTKDDFIHFVLQSPYHKTDTIYRIASTTNEEQIHMQTDDYAMMLHYYANGKIEDWQRRKKELSELIADDAVIFQVLPHGLGIEIYSKKKFINTLTTPTQSLKNIEIIESRRANEQIVKLKFRVKL